jgi:hypothetical protein
MKPLAAASMLVLAALYGGAPAQPAPPPESAALDAIRAKLVALEIESAIAAVDALLAEPGVADATRVAALDLRAQAHAAGGELDAAERDYRAILEIRADYAPKPELVGKKAMDRFTRLQAATIGTIHLDLSPADAALLLDGRPVERDPSGAIKAVAGERKLRAERKGFDGAEVVVRAVAGAETLVKLALVPNARDLVVLTDTVGVAVALDGVEVGSTAPGAGEGAPAELRLEAVGIGEHEIRLEKPCFATENLRQMVRVDLADPSPERLAVVTMRPARTRVTVTGAAYTGELRIDGEHGGRLPLETFTMCPGRRRIQVVASGRPVWSGVVEAGETDVVVDLAPRPGCTLVGGAWPQGWAEAASAWSLLGHDERPAGADLSTPAGWQKVDMPAGTDLALGVVPRGGVAGEDRELLFSPLLNMVEEQGAPPPSARPSWSSGSIGADLVDADDGILVARVDANGPAARAGVKAGDRLLAVNTRRFSRARDARQALAEASGTVKLEIAGATTALEVATVRTPRLDPDAAPGESRAVRAAWAAAEAAAGGPDAPAALASLATMLARAGRDRQAADAWRKVRGMPHAHAAIAARSEYALAGASSEEAAERLMRAKREAEAAGDTALAAAAADRLADLGIAPR